MLILSGNNTSDSVRLLSVSDRYGSEYNHSSCFPSNSLATLTRRSHMMTLSVSCNSKILLSELLRNIKQFSDQALKYYAYKILEKTLHFFSKKRIEFSSAQ